MTLLHNMNFEEIVEQYGLQVMTEETKKALMKTQHIAACCDKIAFGDGMILIQGGNLEYYAGLEYVEPLFVIGNIKMYEAAGNDDQVDMLNDHLCEIVFQVDDGLEV